MEIKFTASPEPKVTWQHNGHKLPDPLRMKHETIFGMTSFTLSHAKRGDSGNYTLTLENPHGKAEVTIKVKVLDKPGPVKHPAVKDINATSATLRWSPPDDNGGSEITGYIVEKREGTRRMWQSVSTVPVCEHTVTGLITGNQYAMRITAENAVGMGEPVEVSDVVTPKSRFGKSLIVFASAWKSNVFCYDIVRCITLLMFCSCRPSQSAWYTRGL